MKIKEKQEDGKQRMLLHIKNSKTIEWDGEEIWTLILVCDELIREPDKRQFRDVEQANWIEEDLE